MQNISFSQRQMNRLKSIIKRVRSSKDAHRVFANFSYLSLLQMAGYVIPLITYPYLAKVIGVEGFGHVAFAMSLIVYFMTITDWGFNYTATRDVARCAEDKDAISNIYSRVLTSKLLLLLFSVIVLAILLLLIPYFRDNSMIIIYAFIAVVGYTLFPEWLFQGIENMKVMVLLNLLSKTVFTMSVFLIIKRPSDYLYQPLIFGIGYLLAGIIALVYVRYRLCVKFKICGVKEAWMCIKMSFDVFLNNLMPNLYNSFSVLLLGFYGGSVSNGILDGATKFYTAFAQFLTVLGRAFFPYLSRKVEKHNYFDAIKKLLTIIFSAVLVFGAKTLVLGVLGAEFEQSVYVLQILGCSLLFHSITNIFGTNYLIIIGKEKLLRQITLICSLIGFIIAFPLIYLFDYLGAAITIAAARVITGVSVYVAAKQIQKTR